MISSGNQIFSHSVKEFNFVSKSFDFSTNDIIYIEYDPKEGKLRFQKNTGLEKNELDIAPPPLGDCYHPCICLYQIGDVEPI
jgi:hypothetical protein